MLRGYLLVDDEREFLALARELLGGPAKVVAEARDGSEAESLLESAKPAVAIVDVHLAGGSGFHVAKRLRERSPELQVVMVSSVDEPSFCDLSRSVGAAGFLPKKLLSQAALENLLGA